MVQLGYESVKYVSVKNAKLALLYYASALGIVIYVVASLIVDRGYQAFEPAVGTTAVKVKGIGTIDLPGGDTQVLDAIDLTYPPIERDAFFVTTNFVRTIDQRPGFCVGRDVPSENCTTDADCRQGRVTEHGIANGTCDTEVRDGRRFCFVKAWCPVENDSSDQQIVVSGVQDFTVFAKVNVEFPAFNRRMGNAESTLLPGVNLFTIGELLGRAGQNITNIRSRGAILLAKVDYNCNLDRGNQCDRPPVHIARIDREGTFAQGFNFRSVVLTGNASRTLTKSTGIRVVWYIFGTGGQFSIVPLFLSLGSGLGLLSVATLVTDFVLQHLIPEKQRYIDRKYEVVEDGHVVQDYNRMTGAE